MIITNLVTLLVHFSHSFYIKEETLHHCIKHCHWSAYYYTHCISQIHRSGNFWIAIFAGLKLWNVHPRSANRHSPDPSCTVPKELKEILINQFLRQTSSHTKNQRNPPTRYQLSQLLESFPRKNHLLGSDPTVEGLILICSLPPSMKKLF